MKNHFALILIGFLLGLTVHGQTNTSDCQGAIPLCAGFYSEETAPPGTGNVFEFTGTCNQGNEVMSLWYTFTVTQAGDLSFILTPNNPADDYDWGMFDITNGGCAGIVSQDGSSPEVSCNSFGMFGENGPTGISTANGGTGNSNGPGDLSGPPFNADLEVTVGQTFALVVMNWSQSLEGYSIDFTGSTADIFDDEQPFIVQASTNCNNNQAQILFSEPIITETVDIEDFTLTGPGGTYTCIDALPDETGSTYEDGFTIIFNESITEGGIYTLAVSDVSGNVEDACGNQAIDAIFEVPFTSPVSFDLLVETACNGDGGSFVIDNIQGGADPFTLLLDGDEQNDFEVLNLEPGTYEIELVDAAECFFIQEIQIPNHDIEVFIPEQDSISCSSTSIDVSGIVVTPEQQPVVDWAILHSDSTLSPLIANTLNPTISASGSYLLTLTDSASGCSVQAPMIIEASESGFVDLAQISFPNVITPNGDSDNDTWRPFLKNDPDLLLPSVMEEYSLIIFNRWGNVVFDSTTGSGNYWNITQEPDGTYYYELRYKITCGKIQEGVKSGYFQIIR